MLEDDAVAGDQGGHDGIDRRHVGIIPRCDDQDHTQRFTQNVSLEFIAVFRHYGRERLFSDRHHVGRALVDPIKFAAIADGAPHHVRQFGHHIIVHVAKPRDTGADQINTVRQGTGSPRLLRRTRLFYHGNGFVFRGDGAFREDRTIDGRDAL